MGSKKKKKIFSFTFKRLHCLKKYMKYFFFWCFTLPCYHLRTSTPLVIISQRILQCGVYFFFTFASYSFFSFFIFAFYSSKNTKSPSVDCEMLYAPRCSAEARETCHINIFLFWYDGIFLYKHTIMNSTWECTSIPKDSSHCREDGWGGIFFFLIFYLLALKFNLIRNNSLWCFEILI